MADSIRHMHEACSAIVAPLYIEPVMTLRSFCCLPSPYTVKGSKRTQADQQDYICRSLIVSGNRGLRQPRLISQTLQSLSLSSCSNLDCLYLSCPQLKRLQACAFYVHDSSRPVTSIKLAVCLHTCPVFEVQISGMSVSYDSKVPGCPAYNVIYSRQAAVDCP